MIKWGRISFVIAVTLELMAILALLITKENKLDQAGKNKFRL